MSDFENNIEQDDDQNISFLDENENNDICGFFNSELNDNNYCFSNENDEFDYDYFDNTTF